MVIRFSPENEHILSIPVIKGGRILKNIKLMPGTNEISQDIWTSVSDSIKGKIESKEIEKVVQTKNVTEGDKKTSANVCEISDMTPKFAGGVIDECFSKESLDEWWGMNLKDDVHSMIRKRYEKLELDIPM